MVLILQWWFDIAMVVLALQLVLEYAGVVDLNESDDFSLFFVFEQVWQCPAGEAERCIAQWDVVSL